MTRDEGMDCGDCLERIHPYLDRELPPTEFAEVQKHLDACRDCGCTFIVERVFLDRLRGGATSDVAPVGLRERLVVRIGEDVRRSS